MHQHNGSYDAQEQCVREFVNQRNSILETVFCVQIQLLTSIYLCLTCVNPFKITLFAHYIKDGYAHGPLQDFT